MTQINKIHLAAIIKFSFNIYEGYMTHGICKKDIIMHSQMGFQLHQKRKSCEHYHGT